MGVNYDEHAKRKLDNPDDYVPLCSCTGQCSKIPNDNVETKTISEYRIPSG